MPNEKLEIALSCNRFMEWAIGGIAIALLVIGLIGQGFEMRKIRVSITKDEEMGSPNIFLDKRNFKWYALIVAGIILWYIAGF